MEFNPTDLSYAGLFVAMLIYVIRSNDAREKKYQETITEDHKVLHANQETINSMVQALNDNTNIKEDIKYIRDRLGVS